jgi:CheY-like chemotaxis protein
MIIETGMEPYVLMLQTDPDDKFIVESTLEEIKPTAPTKFVNSVHEMDDFISKQGQPAVILFNYSGVNRKGYEIVRQLKAHPAYGHIPVVVLGEVSADDYIKEWYKAGANTFIIKPSSIAATQKKIRTFFEYWFDVAEVKP